MTSESWIDLHNMFPRTFGNRLGTAPPNEKDSNVGRVLDIGTGTGIWAIDFGDEHPDAEVHMTSAPERAKCRVLTISTGSRRRPFCHVA
ncbi:uncharacterized protein ColSpa_06174 [Colletotrichum spaethianum]|uniref:Methyltransferase domain-containing protein n=1 Tax=Colletotrichum spaethianum TaxID=700344 RepID=A0AA37LGC8_9PEZI|nr:uncharacterized protein ColSpa_06174 [Colletotrichum spaethianum]GKT45993.1 hypothetical protein ColSpa_06174 [Colletotrichum spaethianum]